jgi:hypothetical protein
MNQAPYFSIIPISHPPEPPKVDAPKDNLNPEDFYVFQGEEELAAVLAEMDEREKKTT